MSRIRSVHPGLFTDEDFVGLSDAAQIFFVGLWTEADDYGAFEWKPVTLKIKLRGASTAAVEPLLEELKAADRVRQYEYNGRQYGVIRNFTRFQRPKFPKSAHFIPSDLRRYAGSTEPITEIDRVEDAPLPPIAEKPPQMEDGGWRMEDGVGEEVPRKPKKELSGRARQPRAVVYVFEGRIIRLAEADFRSWRQAYSAIPDLLAELTTIDGTLAAQKHEGDWFVKVSRWLQAKHERLLKEGGNAFGQGFGAPGFA